MSNLYENSDEEEDYYDEITIDELETNLINQGIPAFEQMKSTLIVGQCNFSENINVGIASYLLPITYVSPINSKCSSKNVYPLTPIGNIISMRIKEKNIGLITSEKNSFPNSLSIKMSIGHKYLDCKLCEKLVHFTGVSKEDDITIGANLIIEHLNKLDDFLTYIKNNRSQAENTINWVLKMTLGPKETRVNNLEFDTHIVAQEELYDTINNNELVIPNCHNKEFTEYLLGYRHRMTDHKDLTNRLLSILKIENNITTKNIDIISNEVHMINYNYKLDFRVNRNMVNTIFDGKFGFSTRFDLDKNSYVALDLPLNDSYVNSKKKSKKHTILVHKTGSVTQSSPNRTLAKEAYLKFMALVLTYKDQIKLTE